MLTPKQKEHFDVFGFLCLRQAFSPDEMAEITQAADQVWREDRGGQPDDGQHQGLAPFAEHNPRLLPRPPTKCGARIGAANPTTASTRALRLLPSTTPGF